MSRMFTCGFEEGNNIAATMMSVTNSPTPVSTPTPHSGNWCLEVNAASEYVGKTFVPVFTSGTFYVRFYIRWPAHPPSTMQIFRLSSSTAATEAAAISVNSSGAVILTNSVTAATDTLNQNLSVDTWYRIELEYVVADSPNGSLTCKVYLGDATTELDTLVHSATDTIPATTTNVGALRLGRTAGTAGTFAPCYDDLCINNTSGSTHNSWLGPGNIQLMVPNSDVSITWEDQTGSAAATFANIDDLNSDGSGTISDTDFNMETVTLNSVDRMGLSNFAAGVPSTATPWCVDVYARVGSDVATTNTVRLKLWDNASTLTDGPNITVTSATPRILGMDEHLAVDAWGYTRTHVNAWEAGYENLTPGVATINRQIYALWVNVEWREATSSNTDIEVPTTIYTGA